MWGKQGVKRNMRQEGRFIEDERMDEYVRDKEKRGRVYGEEWRQFLENGRFLEDK